LEQEIRLWSALGTLACRPVSTVHLGGGTPTFLPAKLFTRLISSCRTHFRTGPQTEWALESTTSELTDDMFTLLADLGFTRLHIGVQSLQDDVRQRIKRREPATSVLRKIAKAVGTGWIVSVDLICGLPGQSLEGLLSDVSSLAAAGVDGFSLYHLQLSSQNRRFAKRYGLTARNHLIDYFLFHAACRWLTHLGYRKTLFNHFAGQRDTNLYFTFPERGEDCLALGTIADGVFHDYHYRHLEYKAYTQNVDATSPGLQGGLRRNALENRLQPLEVAILSGTIPPGLFAEVLGEGSWEKLLHYWQESALVEEDSEDGSLHLTTNGSWLTSTMMAQLFSS